MIFPFSLCVYLVLILLLMIYYPYKTENNNDKRNNIWDTYYFLGKNLFTNIIHHNGSETLNKMNNCIHSIEMSRDEDKKNDSLFTDSINIIFNLGFIINCILILLDYISY